MSSVQQVFRSGPYAELIAQGLRHRNVPYLSGQVGMDEKSHVPESMAEQTVLAYGGTPEVTQTLVAVAGLVLPALKLEIKCIAHL